MPSCLSNFLWVKLISLKLFFKLANTSDVNPFFSKPVYPGCSARNEGLALQVDELHQGLPEEVVRSCKWIGKTISFLSSVFIFHFYLPSFLLLLIANFDDQSESSESIICFVCTLVVRRSLMSSFFLKNRTKIQNCPNFLSIESMFCKNWIF